MEGVASASLCSSFTPLLPSQSFSIKSRKQNRRIKTEQQKRSFSSTTGRVYAIRRGDNLFDDRKYYKYNGQLVDENMIVLRKRVHEIKMIENGNYEEPPLYWMDWEKRYFATNYDSDICEAMGLLQTYLINTRPSFALGILALLALSLSTSTVLIMFHFIEIAKWILSLGIY